MSAPVVVFGATGSVGNSVVKALLKQYSVRAVTRDPCSPKAAALTSLGAKVIKVTDTDPYAVEDALDGAVAAFVITNSDNSREEGYLEEVCQGQAIADGCKRAGIQHVIYSTQLSVVKTTGIRARHMDAKAEVEYYMKKIGLPLTSVVIPCLYQQFLHPPFRPTRIDQGVYGFDIPMGSVHLTLISADDIGHIVYQLVTERDKYLNKTISLCGDKLSIQEMASVLSSHLCPMLFQDKQLTLYGYRQLQYEGIDDLAYMFDFYTRVDQRTSLELNKRLNPNLLSFSQWIAANKQEVIEAMDYPEPQKVDPWEC